MKTGNLSLALVIIALIAGLSLGAVATNMLVKQETQVVEVPVEVKTLVEVEVEVEKDFNAYLSSAVDKYLEDIKADLDKFEEVINVKVSDDYSISFTEDNSTIAFNVEYRIIDNLKEKRTNYACDVSILSEEGEEDVITAVC